MGNPPVNKNKRGRSDGTQGGRDSGNDHSDDENDTKHQSSPNQQNKGKTGNKSNNNHKNDDNEDHGTGKDQSADKLNHPDGNDDNSNDDKGTANAGNTKQKGKLPGKTGNINEGSEETNGSKNRGNDTGEDKDITKNPDGPAEAIAQGFDRAGIPMSTRLLQYLKPRLGDNITTDNEGEPSSDASRTLHQGLQAAMNEVDLNIHMTSQKTNGLNDEQRTAKCISNPEIANKFTEALKAVVSDDRVKTALNNAGLKVGSFGVRVLAAVGGLALVGVGSFVAIVSQGEESTAITSSISSQVVRDAKLVDGKNNEKFEEKALEKSNAQELMSLMGTNEAEVQSSGTMSQGALRTYGEFKLMAAVLNAEKQGLDATQP